MVLKKLIVGCYYTVAEGRFEGITDIAIDGGTNAHCLESIDFPDEGIISFWGCFNSLRKATASEELALRRRMDELDE